MKTYYKVVRGDKLNDEFKYSAFSKGKAEVIYFINKWVYPPQWLKEKGFGLLAFDSLNKAKSFLKDNLPHYGFEIWECEIGLLWELPPYNPPPELAGGRINPKYTKNIFFPYGTICTDKIKLLRRAK